MNIFKKNDNITSFINHMRHILSIIKTVIKYFPLVEKLIIMYILFEILCTIGQN